MRCWLQSPKTTHSHPEKRAGRQGYNTSYYDSGTASADRDSRQDVSEVARLLDSWLETDDNFVKLLTFVPSPNRKIVDWPYRPDLKHAPQIDIAGLF